MDLLSIVLLIEATLCWQRRAEAKQKWCRRPRTFVALTVVSMVSTLDASSLLQNPRRASEVKFRHLDALPPGGPFGPGQSDVWAPLKCRLLC